MTKWIIGLQNINGDWTFDDGSSFNYENWARGSPNGVGIKFNAAILTGNITGEEEGKWSTIGLLDGQGFICEHEAETCETTTKLFVSRSLNTDWYGITQSPIGKRLVRISSEPGAPTASYCLDFKR